jgi:hypothetical protein
VAETTLSPLTEEPTEVAEATEEEDTKVLRAVSVVVMAKE